MGIELILAGVGGLILAIFVVGFLFMWFSGRDGESTTDPPLANANDLDVGDAIFLGGDVGGVFRVTEIGRYDVPDEPDEAWSEVTVSDDKRTIHLSSERDEGRWVWTLNDAFEEADLIDVPGLDKVVWNGDPPPRSLEFMGMTFEVEEDCHHYEVNVDERKVGANGTIEEDDYPARVTEYEDGAGSSLALEIWNGGRMLTLGRIFNGEVRLHGRRDRG